MGLWNDEVHLSEGRFRHPGPPPRSWHCSFHSSKIHVLELTPNTLEMRRARPWTGGRDY